MFEWFYRLFLPTENPDVTQSLVTIMLAVGGGILLGRIKIFKVSLGVSAVMFVGLVLGHYGYRINAEILHFIRDFGLILFVYGIGIQVGPSFFSSFKKEGLKLNFLAVSTVILGGIVTYVLFRTTGLGMENMVGVMSGSVTNTPGLGAAKSTLQEIQLQFPEKSFADPAIAYAITYPLGVFGIILIIILSKLIFKIDPDKEMRKFRLMKIKSEEPLIAKKCRITNPDYFGKSIFQTLKEVGHEVLITRLKHSKNDAVFSPALDSQLLEKDVMMVFGIEKEVDAFIQKIGRESSDLFIETTSDIQTKNIFVTNPKAIHKKLSELDLYNKYELKVTRVIRAGKEMLARPSLELFYGDKMHVVGTKEAIDEVEVIIGNSEKKLMEPDFLSLFGGLLIGVILGSVPIMIPSLPVPIKLGFAAGPLIAALLISRYGGIGVIHSYINNGAIFFMKDLGICLFFAAVGVYAGEGFSANFIQYNGWMMMYYGMFITFVPLITLVLVGTFVFKLNFLQLTGLMSGTYTDPAALSFSTAYLDSDVPIQSYATVYPLVTIFRIFIAQLLILMFVG
ncbi:MAG: putative transporter [Flavobacteriaceae bacterium]|nr:putative transporter [Flavobacteriaceae bacterium]